MEVVVAIQLSRKIPVGVTFDYDDKFLTAKPNGISGSFQLFYEINKSVVENTNEIRIDLGEKNM